MSDAKTKSATPAERKEKFTTLSGIPLERVYTPDAVVDSEREESIGFPGEYPFTRGIYPTMYRGRLWTMRQYAGFGTVQNDVLKEYIARGTYIYPVRPAMRIVTDIFSWCRDHLPKWNTISISGYHIREAGSTAVQEVAFTLADGIAYVEAALHAGLGVDEFAPQLSFFFNAHNDLLEEIAKYRAARRLWARLMRERFQARDARSLLLRFHAQTAGSSLTAQQPENNIVRVAIQALAAVLGGCQSLHTNSLDEALALPTEDAALIALRTQQIIAHETGVTNTIDPVAGSYAIEQLTNEIEAGAQTYIDKIHAMGGPLDGTLRAIESGFIQGEIQKAAYEFQRAVEKNEQIVVGVNDFKVQEERPITILRVEEQIARDQIERLKAFRAKRDSARVKTVLGELARRAAGAENLLPAILDAVENNATVGEISDTLRRVFREYRESVVI